MANKLKMDRKTEFKEILPIPSNMLVEVTNACNLSCVFCAHSKMKRKVGMMNLELFENIARQAYEGGTREIGFYLTGEPLINKRLSEYIGIAKKIGFEYIYMDTNGILATLDTMKKIIDAGIDSIKFSINGGVFSYEKIHGRDCYDIVVNNLINLSNYIKAENLNIKLFVSYVICNDNQKEYDLLYAKLKDYVDDIECFMAFNQGGHMYEMNDGIMVDNEVRMANAPCKMIFNRLHITYEGLLTACCVDFDAELIVGDLKENSLYEAWNSKKMISLRRMHLTNQIHNRVMCYNCINNTNYLITPL